MTAETYVKLITKKVKCSKQKRQEIYKQLLADIHEEMRNGMPFDSIMLRMGEPIAIAEEFNQNLSETEYRKYKKRKVVTGITIAAAVLAIIIAAAVWVLPSGAAFGNSGLFMQAEVEEKSEEIIRFVNEGDYEALRAASNEQLQKILTQEVIETAKKQAGEDWGDFQQFGKFYMAEQKQQGKTRAVVQVNAFYENTGITYTLFFDADMKLSGFYIK